MSVLETAKLKIEISLDSGSISFEDKMGRRLLAEPGVRHGTGEEETLNPDQTIVYSGDKLEVKPPLSQSM